MDRRGTSSRVGRWLHWYAEQSNRVLRHAGRNSRRAVEGLLLRTQKLVERVSGLEHDAAQDELLAALATRVRDLQIVMEALLADDLTDRAAITAASRELHACEMQVERLAIGD